MLIDPLSILALVATITLSWLVPQTGHPSKLQLWLAGENKEFNYRVWVNTGLTTRRWSTELNVDVPLHHARHQYEEPLADFLVYPTTTTTVTFTATLTPIPTPKTAISRVFSAPFTPNEILDTDTEQHVHGLTVESKRPQTVLWLVIFLVTCLTAAKAISDFVDEPAPSPPPSPKGKPTNGLKNCRAKPGAIVVKDHSTILAAVGLPPAPPSPGPADEASFVDIVVPAPGHRTVEQSEQLNVPPFGPFSEPLTTIIGSQIDFAPSVPSYQPFTTVVGAQIDIPPSVVTGSAPSSAPSTRTPTPTPTPTPAPASQTGILRPFNPQGYGHTRAANLPMAYLLGLAPDPTNRRTQQQDPFNRNFKSKREQNEAVLEDYQRRYPNTGKKHNR